jgi:DNA-binding XRE family transcriptional regulator
MNTRREQGQRWRRVRMLCDASQAEVAEHIGASRSHLAKIESGANVVSDALLDRFCHTYAQDGHALALRDYILTGSPLPPLRGLVAVPLAPGFHLHEDKGDPGGYAAMPQQSAPIGAPGAPTLERVLAATLAILDDPETPAMLAYMHRTMGLERVPALTALITAKLSKDKGL